MNSLNIDLLYFESCQYSLRYKFIKNFKHPQLGDCQLVREKASNRNVIAKDKEVLSREEFDNSMEKLKACKTLKTNNALIQLHAYTYKVVNQKTEHYRFTLFYEYLDQDLEKDLNLHQKSCEDYKENILMKVMQDMTTALLGLAGVGMLENVDFRPVNIFLFKDMKDLLSFKFFHYLFCFTPLDQIKRGISYYKFYLSPEDMESLQGKNTENSGLYSQEKKLVFSLGLLLLNLGSANATYERIYRLDKVEMDEKTLEIKEKFIKMRYSEPLCLFIKKMLDKEPSFRPSLNEILYFTRSPNKKAPLPSNFSDSSFSMMSFELSKPMNDVPVGRSDQADSSFEQKRALLSNEGKNLENRVENRKTSFKNRLSVLQERMSMSDSIKKPLEEPMAKTLTGAHTSRKSSKFKPLDNNDDMATVKRLQTVSQSEYQSDNEWTPEKMFKLPAQPAQVPEWIQELEQMILYDSKTNSFKKGLMQIKYPDGSVYKGQSRGSDSFRHGLGVYYYSNGDIYLGDWLDNMINGKGVYYFNEGEYYEGKFKEFKREGTGIYQYNTGNRYEGEWKHDMKNGFGVFYYSNSNESYEGTWLDDEKDGEGIYTFSNGDKFVGRWAKGKKSGKGKVLFQDKGVFEGEWLEDAAHGFGVLRYYNGDVFEGNYESGVKSGGGIYCHVDDGSKYAGQWLEDERTGNGIYCYSNGDKYTGMFLKGKRCGKGGYLYVNGDQFDGDWADDKKEGFGKFIFKKGGYYEGEWKDNMMEGEGFMMYANGDNYEGEWKNGKKHGKGVYLWTQGLGFDGMWKDDVMITEEGNFINNEGIRF